MAEQITMGEREQIAQFRGQGLSRAEIGRLLGRHPTSIGHELTRNSECGEYWPTRGESRGQVTFPGLLRGCHRLPVRLPVSQSDKRLNCRHVYNQPPAAAPPR